MIRWGFRNDGGNYAARTGVRFLHSSGTYGDDGVGSITYRTSLADAALASHRALSGPSDCRKRALAARRTAAASQVKPQIRARVFVLTDHRCFSSCLIATHDFRMLGAAHVGETTDANTSYAEVRAAVLPSGLAAASTLMAITSGPPQVGPFVPAVKFDGNIADTAALERWIPRLTTVPH